MWRLRILWDALNTPIGGALAMLLLFATVCGGMIGVAVVGAIVDALP